MKLQVFLFILFLSAFAQDLYEGPSDVVHLTQSNFDSLVTNTNDMWLIEFYAPWCGHCKAFAPDYKKIARLLRGIVKVGAVDMTKDQAVGSKYNIQGFPTILFFGSRKEQPHQFNTHRSVDGVINFVFEQMKSLVERRKSPSAGGSSNSGGQKQEGTSDDKDVVVLTDSNFDKMVKGSKDLWLIEFYAPWCGHCKNLAPHWNAAATRLKGKVKLGKVDATAEKGLAQRYGINAYPTIKVFPAGLDLDKPLEYEGARTTDGIEGAALEYLKKYPPKKEVFQLTSESIFQEECVDKNGVCIIAFLPHLIDTGAEGRKKYIETLETAAKKNIQYPYYYFWSQAYDQKPLEKAMNLGSGYPTVVAISPSKKKYAVMRGAYRVDEVSTFLRDLIRGYERLYDYEELPKMPKVSPWDGSDYKEEL